MLGIERDRPKALARSSGGRAFAPWRGQSPPRERIGQGQENVLTKCVSTSDLTRPRPGRLGDLSGHRWGRDEPVTSRVRGPRGRALLAASRTVSGSSARLRRLVQVVAPLLRDGVARSPPGHPRSHRRLVHSARLAPSRWRLPDAFRTHSGRLRGILGLIDDSFTPRVGCHRGRAFRMPSGHTRDASGASSVSSTTRSLRASGAIEVVPSGCLPDALGTPPGYPRSHRRLVHSAHPVPSRSCLPDAFRTCSGSDHPRICDVSFISRTQCAHGVPPGDPPDDPGACTALSSLHHRDCPRLVHAASSTCNGLSEPGVERRRAR